MIIKPYKDLETAIWQYQFHERLKSVVKIKCSNVIVKDEWTLTDAAILCKVLKTFSENFSVFKSKFVINHFGHILWDQSMWQLKYYKLTYTFTINSSNYLTRETYIQDTYKDKCCTEYDISTYAYDISNHINWMLNDLRRYAPSERYKSIYDDIERIFNSD